MTFWTLVIGGIIALISGLVTNNFPAHNTIGLASKVLELMGSTIGLVMTVALSNFDMTWPFIIFTIIVVLELVKAVYAAWRRIKGLVL